MKTILTILNFLVLSCCFGQNKTTIYCFPGQGSDKRIFDSLSIDTNFTIQIIEYGTPKKDMTMETFAKELSKQIDTTQNYVLLGVSLGGMLCAEMCEFLNPEKTIIISSAKNKNELPFRYQFQHKIPLYQIFGGNSLLAGAKILQPIVEPDRSKNKETFKQMLVVKDPEYMKRTIALIMQWERESNSKKIYHIHGNNDKTLPLKNISNPNFIIEDGSHMMTLTRANEVSQILNKLLNSE